MLEILVKCPAGKNSPQNVIQLLQSWSFINFRPVSVVGWPTLKSIPFLKFLIIFWSYFYEK